MNDNNIMAIGKEFTSGDARIADTYATHGYVVVRNVINPDDISRQTMLFDQNTETPAHQDWWYLGSVPGGHLIAAWIALEDICEDVGRFYVVDKTMNVDLHSDVQDLPHEAWLQRIKNYVEENPDRVHAPEMRKGDVLLWNSRTIHGALPTKDPRFSRKSLAVHYLPSQYQFGNLFKTKNFITYSQYNSMNFYRNQPDYSSTNALKNFVKMSVYNRPKAIRFFRKIQ